MRLSSTYVGLFWHRTPYISAVWPTEVGQGYVYSAPDFTLHIGLGGLHGEPIQDWLDALHTTYPSGSSAIVGMTSSGDTALKLPPDASLFRFHANREALHPEAITTEGFGGHFIDPLSGEHFILVDSRHGPEILREMPSTRAAVTGLVLREHRSEKKKVGTSRPYDPISAHRHELRHKIAPALFSHLATALDVCKRADDADLAGVVLALRDHLQSELKAADFIGGVSLLSSEFPSVDYLNNELQELGPRIQWLAARIVDYSPIPVDGERVFATRYTDRARRHVLMIARGFVTDVARRLNQESTWRGVPLVVFGDESLVGVTERLDFRQRILTLPRMQMLRMGCLPMLTRYVPLVGTSFPQTPITLTADDTRVLTESASTSPSSRGLQAADPRLISEAVLMTHLKDVVAILACGPAYLFAMTRFAGPHVGQNPYEPRVDFRRRIEVCLSVLAHLGITHAFSSDSLSTGVMTDVPLSLLRVANSYVRYPYTPSDHERATTHVCQRLADGEIVNDSPTILLNSLWHAVGSGGPHVNELSLAASLASWA